MTPRPWSVGTRGARVTPERRGERWFLRLWDPAARDGQGGYRRIALGRCSEAEARAAARRQCAALLAGDRVGPEVTVARVLDEYERAVVDGGQLKHPTEHRRRLALWRRYLGPATLVAAVDAPTLERFVAERRRGLWTYRPAGARTIAADLEALQRVFTWATRRRAGSGFLLPTNPARGFPVPSNPSPRRPVAPHAHFVATRAAAEQVDPSGRFGLFLDLLEGLGWRASAVCRLRAEDVDRARSATEPHGRIHKVRQHDKEGVDRWLPLSAALREALDRHPVLTGWIFPAPRRPGQPWSRWHARDLHERAQRAAGLPILGLHAYRRKWATDRKHLPRSDVMFAGGWEDARTFQRSYQQPDPDTLLAVMSTRRTDTTSTGTSTVGQRRRQRKKGQPHEG